MSEPTSRRLIDRFPVGCPVDVLFRGVDTERWIPATVASHAHPGVWVVVGPEVHGAGGSRWFVTNGTRIRPRDAIVFKIATAAEWQATQRDGVFPGSDADLRDGYVHLSTAAQVEGTFAKHFAGQHDLVLLDVDLAVLARIAPGALRWEPSRGGALFPHVHGALPLQAIVRSRPLPADGRPGVD